MYERANRLRAKGHLLTVQDTRGRYHAAPVIPAPAKLSMEIEDGVVLVGSDCHYWPGPASTAHRGFVRFIKELKPRAVVLNGDVFDGAMASRWARLGWQHRPNIKQELEAVTERVTEIEDAHKGALIWTAGNHDGRFETKIANSLPEYEGVQGFSLKDHFQRWKPCWSFWINQNVVIKHRFKSGIHATFNNTVWAGMTVVTGHLHSLRVTPFSDYNGTRWGVDTGTMADPYGQQFLDYCETSPVNWRSGFAVLTFRDGKLLWPEIAAVDGDNIDFRGQLIGV